MASNTYRNVHYNFCLKIYSYRLRRLMDKNCDDTNSSKNLNSDNEIISDLLDIIEKHRSAIKYIHIKFHSAQLQKKA